MGLKGNWKEEKYQFKIHDDESGFFKVFAYTENGEEAGNASFRVEGEMKGWTHIVPSEKELTVIAATVHPEHQRKGICSEMYRLIEEYTGRQIIEGVILQSEDAKALWKSRKK